MVLAACPNDFDTMFPKVLTVVTAGVDFDAMEKNGKDATSEMEGLAPPVGTTERRNWMINAPPVEVLPMSELPEAISSRLSDAGYRLLGELVQAHKEHVVIDLMAANRYPDYRPEDAQKDVALLEEAMANYGLRFGMTASDLVNWIRSK